MKNIVLIPCWRRDDFLATTLDYIQSAEGADRNVYVFLLEKAYSHSVREIANKFPLEKIIHQTPYHSYQGNTFNILEGYRLSAKLAQQRQSELIYLIEEDIFISKDFFTYHEAVQAKFDSFVVSGIKNQNDGEDKPNDPSLVYYHDKYQSLGVSWKLSNLAPILAHANHEYYRTRKRYLIKHFPKSILGMRWDEQDGLINRIMETNGLKGIYPCVARGFHAGFSGYNRPGTYLTGPLEERVEKLKTMNDDEMNAFALTIKDIKRIDPDGYGPQDFQLLTSS